MEMQMAAKDYDEIVAKFDRLPDAAIIPDQAAAQILGMSRWTLKRANPIPQFSLSPRHRGRRVGDIRRLQGAATQQLATA
jgi:hypothetical protein